MTRSILLLLSAVAVTALQAQGVAAKLKTAFGVFESDQQLQYGLASLYVQNASTGAVVYDKNSRVGLAPASTQKIITSAAAYELLGKDFRYRTNFGYANRPAGSGASNHIIITPSGDPTLGSWRWKSTSEAAVFDRIAAAFRKGGITSTGSIVISDSAWQQETIPDGWIWQDIGNYYGAGAGALNWRENQYDIILRSGKDIGSQVQVLGTVPAVIASTVASKVKAAGPGTGDNAYVYYSGFTKDAVVRGTIPINENRFVISAAFANSAPEFMNALGAAINKQGNASVGLNDADKHVLGIIHTEISPPLDSIIYWFNKKSINLYGEALVKTLGVQQKGRGSTETGIEVLKNLWKNKGIDPGELNVVDGSGLSPLNRVTTHAQVAILQYAQQQAWFNSFYHSLPEYNGMKLKSGTIRGVKGFCGYHTSKDGIRYVISFLVNNYSGSAASLVQKMYRVLDVLK